MSGKLDVPGPRFRHMDGEKWLEVRAQMHGDKRVSVNEKWLEVSPKCMTLVGRYDPGMIVHKHGHNSHHVIYVMKGSMMCGDTLCTPGMHIVLDEGSALGPIVAGPEGVEMFEVWFGDPRSWAADPEGFDALLAEKGITKLPHPPIDFPEWMKELPDGKN